MNTSLGTEHACERVKCNYLLNSSVLNQVLSFMRRQRLAPNQWQLQICYLI